MLGGGGWSSENLEDQMVGFTRLQYERAGGIGQVFMGPASESPSDQGHDPATQVTDIS